MKQALWMAMLALAAAGVACAADPAPGDMRAQVVAMLGNPDGRMASGKTEILFYDRGTVELRDGKVIESKLLTAEQIVARRDADAAQARAEAQRLAVLLAEGSTEKAKLLADPMFAKLSAADQLAEWQKFSSKYPGVDVKTQLGDSQQTLRLAQAEQDRKKAAERAAAAKIAEELLQHPDPATSSGKYRKAMRARPPRDASPAP